MNPPTVESMKNFSAEFFGGQHTKNLYKCKVLTLAEHQSFDIRQRKEHFNSFFSSQNSQIHSHNEGKFNVNISDYLLREK